MLHNIQTLQVVLSVHKDAWDKGECTKQIGLNAFIHYEVMQKERVKRHHVILSGSVVPIKPLLQKIKSTQGYTDKMHNMPHTVRSQW